MSWIDVAWTMMASASLMLGLIHLFVWQRQRSQYEYLLFSVLAASVAAFGAFELQAMSARTPAQYASIARWAQIPLTVAVVSMLWFVHRYFGTGRVWLACTAAGFRLLTLAANFTTGETVLLRPVTGLDHVTVAGAVVAIPVGVLNPWIVVPQISNLLLVAFVVDATIALWRRGDATARRRALLVGGSLVLCITVVVAISNLILTGVVRAPTLLTPCFLLIVLAMGYELVRDVVHAAALSRELRESERRMELAAQAAELAFWSWDVGRDDIWMTARGRALFEIPAPTRIDFEQVLSRVHADDRPAIRAAMQGTRRDGATFEQEFRLALPSGRLRFVAARGQVERGEAGAPARLRGVVLDVTERSRLEREAALQRSELAHLSRVATLGELSGSLAHEINQPLMGILSNAQAAQRFLAGDDVNLDEVREILADIVEDDKRAGEVIRRLRALLKKGEVQHGPLDIATVVDEVLRLTRNDLMNRDVTIATDLARDMPPILGDRIQLQQVLLNLVMNACDAMERTQPREIAIRARRPDRAALEIAVSDRGCGIPPADLERIFDPFVTTKEHGTGLGLSVCRTIVAAHGGRLWAENDSECGATFRFTLPLAGDAK